MSECYTLTYSGLAALRRYRNSQAATQRARATYGWGLSESELTPEQKQARIERNEQRRTGRDVPLPEYLISPQARQWRTRCGYGKPKDELTPEQLQARQERNRKRRQCKMN